MCVYNSLYSDNVCLFIIRRIHYTFVASLVFTLNIPLSVLSQCIIVPELQTIVPSSMDLIGALLVVIGLVGPSFAELIKQKTKAKDACEPEKLILHESSED